MRLKGAHAVVWAAAMLPRQVGPGLSRIGLAALGRRALFATDRANDDDPRSSGNG
jgi:hypothetical protein